MIPSPTTQQRLMVPRWRSLRLTNQSRELAVPRKVDPGRRFSKELTKRIGNWRRSPENLIASAELVEAALVEGEDREAIGAAKSILEVPNRATNLVEQQAVQLLRRLRLENEIPDGFATYLTSVRWKRHTREHPRDAIGWVELALVQTKRGGTHNAQRSIQVALQLAPNNRHVLRSASRFYLHYGDPERAHDILLRAESTKSDPWLIASEIAIARLARRRPHFHKRGLSLLESQMVPREVTELAGSLATDELLEGSRKKARKFFKQSVTDPNGNALAQAEWASPHLGTELLLESQLQSVAEPFEARTLHEEREEHFDNVIVEATNWSEIEPYSIRPFEYASLSATIIEKYAEAVELADRGLQIRPHAPSLLNNRAFALALLGEYEKAAACLGSISEAADPAVRFVKHANMGLIALGQGKKEQGVAEYEASIAGFRSLHNAGLAYSAAAHLAWALARSNYVHEAEAMLLELSKTMKDFGTPPAKRAYRKAELIVAARQHRIRGE